jgi:hypothetical protein
VTYMLEVVTLQGALGFCLSCSAGHIMHAAHTVTAWRVVGPRNGLQDVTHQQSPAPCVSQIFFSAHGVPTSYVEEAGAWWACGLHMLHACQLPVVGMRVARRTTAPET